MIEIDEVYLEDELILKQAKFVLVNETITVQINQKTVEYENSYTAFTFNEDTNELEAPHFKLAITTQRDSKKLSEWLMSLSI